MSQQFTQSSFELSRTVKMNVFYPDFNCINSVSMAHDADPQWAVQVCTVDNNELLHLQLVSMSDLQIMTPTNLIHSSAQRTP